MCGVHGIEKTCGALVARSRFLRPVRYLQPRPQKSRPGYNNKIISYNLLEPAESQNLLLVQFQVPDLFQTSELLLAGII